MTARFERLSILDGTILASMLAILAVFALPSSADAASNKTSLVFEIKNFQTIKIPEIPTVGTIADLMGHSEKIEIAATTIEASTVNPVQVPITALADVELLTVTAKPVVTTSINKTSNTVPAKKTGTDRVYMHEPQIRAYVCPKLGDKCNTFIAILKAENGTHECTRDNRGLNRNGTIDIGLTQINWSPASPYSFEQLQDCKFNLDIALQKYEKRGFQPWAAYNSGRYKKHLPAVLASAAAIKAAAESVETAVALPIN